MKLFRRKEKTEYDMLEKRLDTISELTRGLGKKEPTNRCVWCLIANLCYSKLGCFRNYLCTIVDYLWDYWSKPKNREQSLFNHWACSWNCQSSNLIDILCNN